MMAKGQNVPTSHHPIQVQRGAHSTAKFSTHKTLSDQVCSLHQSHIHITCILHLVWISPRFCTKTGISVSRRCPKVFLFVSFPIFSQCLKWYITTPLFLIANFIKHTKLACFFFILSFANHLHGHLLSFLPDAFMLTSKVTAKPVLIFFLNIQLYKYIFYQRFWSCPWELM